MSNGHEVSWASDACLNELIARTSIDAHEYRDKGTVKILGQQPSSSDSPQLHKRRIQCNDSADADIDRTHSLCQLCPFLFSQRVLFRVFGAAAPFAARDAMRHIKRVLTNIKPLKATWSLSVIR